MSLITAATFSARFPLLERSLIFLEKKLKEGLRGRCFSSLTSALRKPRSDWVELFLKFNEVKDLQSCSSAFFLLANSLRPTDVKLNERLCFLQLPFS